MIKPDELIRSDVFYQRDGKIFHFIMNEEERPDWSKTLESYLVSNRVNLQMKRKYTYQKKISRHHNRLWNGGNGWGTVKLYDRQDGQFVLVDEIEATHVGCEYGEYDHAESY